MMRLVPVLLLFIAGVLPASAVRGQPANEAPRIQYWVHASPSLTTLGTGGSMGLTLEADRHVFSLRVASTDPTPGHETWDVGVLYGRALFIRAFTFSASTGVAVVSGRRYTTLFGNGPGSDLETMIGFPLEGTITWSAARVLALGVRGFANVNTGQPFGGLGMTVQVGRIR
jgi:hypothetical protein